MRGRSGLGCLTSLRLAQGEAHLGQVQASHAVDQPAQSFRRQILGLQVLGQVHEADRDVEVLEPLPGCLGSVSSGFVAVEDDDHLLDVSEEPSLGLGQVAAHGRDRVREPGLMELQDREEALDKDDAGVGAVLVRPMQVMEDEVLAEALGELVLAVLLDVDGLEPSAGVGHQMAIVVVDRDGDRAPHDAAAAVADPKELGGFELELAKFDQVRVVGLEVQRHAQGRVLLGRKFVGGLGGGCGGR